MNEENFISVNNQEKKLPSARAHHVVMVLNELKRLSNTANYYKRDVVCVQFDRSSLITNAPYSSNVEHLNSTAVYILHYFR